MKSDVLEISVRPATGRSTSQELLTGWGRTSPTLAEVSRLRTAEDIEPELHARSPRGVIARGLGRCYGDAAQNGGGTVVVLDGLTEVVAIDRETGVATVEAGVTIAELIRAVVPLGWFVPVTPGTSQVTVGGAVAADVHGKNQHRVGDFCDHVDSFVLHSPAGISRVTREGSPDVFWATAGGMGLTGVVSEVTLRLEPIETAFVRTVTHRKNTLDELIEVMAAHDDDHQHSVAWIDCVAGGRSRGRGVLTFGDHATVSDLPPRLRRQPLRQPGGPKISVPPGLPGGLINEHTVRAFNRVYFARAPRDGATGISSLAPYFHPLDVLADWNRLYGGRGFLQYQFAVPFGREELVHHALESLASAHVYPSLAVLKRFGRESGGHLGFPMPGWTLALDIPGGLPGTRAALDKLDAEVAAAGGRVYLAKDSRMRADAFAAMYPRLEEWRRIQSGLDPEGVLQSDLSRRLGLVR